jgi:hypothetical protein
MNAHQFASIKLDLLKSAVCDFCQTYIATAKTAPDESTTGEITVGQITILERTVFVFSLLKGFLCEIFFSKALLFYVVVVHCFAELRMRFKSGLIIHHNRHIDHNRAYCVLCAYVVNFAQTLQHDERPKAGLGDRETEGLLT